MRHDNAGWLNTPQVSRYEGVLAPRRVLDVALGSGPRQRWNAYADADTDLVDFAFESGIYEIGDIGGAALSAYP